MKVSKPIVSKAKTVKVSAKVTKQKNLVKSNAAITSEKKTINKAESNEKAGDKKIEASLVAAKMHSSIKAKKVALKPTPKTGTT
jgi:hypothetical protein